MIGRWGTIVVISVLLGACEGTAPGSGAGPMTGPSANGSVVFDVLMDAPSPPGEQLSFTSYFPAAFQVHPGDTIRFTNESDLGVPHTVTFGVAADRSDQPSISLPEDPDADNPAVASACFTSAPPATDLLECDEAPGSSLALRPYAGSGYWNTGVGTTGVMLDPAIAPGSYPFLCIYHEAMTGVLEVVPPDTDVPSPARVAGDGETAQASAVSGSDPAIPVPSVEVGPGETAIVAGWGEGAVLVQAFEPSALEVQAGSTVTWVSPVYVHTVSVPVIVGGAAPDSGVIGPFPELRSDRFSVTFDEPGTYPFICTFHAGMEGELVVT